jgi:bacillithiol system protein YtxJ
MVRDTTQGNNKMHKFSTFVGIKTIFMGFLKTLFGGTSEPKEAKVLPWIALTRVEQLKDIKQASLSKTQVIFKYSSRCGVSRMVLNQFVTNYKLSDDALDLYFLDLINYREVSNETAYAFQVVHESPQVLVIKNGVVVAHASHGAINSLDLSKFV